MIERPKTYKRYLPIWCYASKADGYRPKPLVVNGVVVHYFSGKWAFPDDRYNPDKCWELFYDFNLEKAHREYGWYMDEKVLPTSAHIMIARDGLSIETVPLRFEAWHAGVSEFFGRRGANHYTVGIELIGEHGVNFEDAQYDALARWCAYLMYHHRFDLSHIVGHSDVAPGRKQDPGPSFDWRRLMDAIVAIRGSNTESPA